MEGVREGEKKIRGELRVQNQRRKGKEPTCHPVACPAVGAEGRRASTGKPSIGETLTGLVETSVNEDTVYKEVKGALKKPPGGEKFLPQPQGSEPRRGDKPETDRARETVEGASEGPQTQWTGVKGGPDPTTTLSKPGGRPGEASSQEHRSAGESAKGLTKVVSPSSGPILGQERGQEGPWRDQGRQAPHLSLRSRRDQPEEVWLRRPRGSLAREYQGPKHRPKRYQGPPRDPL